MSDDILTDDDLDDLEEMLAEIEDDEPIKAEEPDQEPEPEPEPKPKRKKAAAKKAAAPRKVGVVQAFINPEELKEDIQYSEAAISNAYSDQASKFVHYAHLAQQAAHQTDRLKSKLDLTEAKIDKEIRDEAADKGSKVTEKYIANQIILDKRYQKALENYHEAKMISGLTKEALDAFRQRRDMLIQVGADLREEMKGELRMRAKEDRKSDIKDRALSAAAG